LNSYPRHSDYGNDPFYHEDEICDACLLRRQDLIDGIDLIYNAKDTPCGEPLCVYYEDWGYDRLHRGYVGLGALYCTKEYTELTIIGEISIHTEVVEMTTRDMPEEDWAPIYTLDSVL
jgi:hypothetical protein